MTQDFFDEYENEYEYEDEYNDEYPADQVTQEDVWYALTDGMEGDYPGPDFDYDCLGF